MDQARKKVLLLLHDLSPTGAPKVALSAFEHLRDRVDLWTITYQGGPLGEQFARLGRLQTLVSYAWPGMPAAPQALLRFLLHRTLSLSKGRLWSHRLRRWQPDLIYINSVVGLLAAKRLQLPPAPILLHVHEMDSFLRVLVADAPELVLGLPDRYIAVSEAVAEALTARFGVDPARVTVVPAFVDPASVPAPSTRLDESEAERRPDTPFVVGGAGVISWVKGPQLWLLMAAEVKRRLGAGHVRFVWVGVPDNDDGWQFREMARKLKLTEDLDCISFTSRPLDFYADFDVFALTSWEETASLALMENMLLETPVLCFAGTGGPREFAGDAGVVLEEFSPKQMADAVCALAADPQRRRALGQAGRQRVLDNFTADHQVPRLWAEMQQLALQRRSRRS